MNSDSTEKPSVIGQLLFSSQRSVFRFETLPRYLMKEERAALQAWTRGERFDWPEEVLDFVAATRDDVARGVRHTRVRLIPNPISTYFRFELAFYPLLEAAGVDLRFISGAAFTASTKLAANDFYAFDSSRVVRLLYDAEGVWQGEAEVREEHRDQYLSLERKLLRDSVPFAEYSQSIR